MRQFNYYGQVDENELGDEDEAEVQKFEKEIEEVLRNRATSAKGDIININKGNRLQSAVGAKRNLANAKYRGKIGEDHVDGLEEDIYEDEESSDDEDDDI